MSTHGGGSIICNASVAGLRARAGSSPYSASKAGVISLVQTAASQLQGTRVRVNAVCPGLIDTDMTRGVFDRARERGVLEDVERLGALHRRGLPDEVAGTVLFLASEDSSFVNGQAIAVCGGFSSTHPFVGMGTPLRTVKDG
jgi:NAD(P)-dependent dehydrogenase (short-subunit alcohol dehydrogenase family)